MFKRITWHGEVIISSLVTAQQVKKEETLIIVYEFDDQGLMKPHFKAAYASDYSQGGNKIGLKLQFSKTKESAWSAIDDGPLIIQGTFDSPYPDGPSPERNSVGGLSVPYRNKKGEIAKTGGQIGLWNLQNDFRPYRTWQYQGFWNAPVGPELKPPLTEVVAFASITIDGRGHATDDTFVRSMTYAHNGRPLYTKSSVLKNIETREQASLFKKFVS